MKYHKDKKMCQTQHNLAKFVSFFYNIQKEDNFTYLFAVSLSVKRDEFRVPQ